MENKSFLTKKTRSAEDFIEKLHHHLEKHPKFPRGKELEKNENEIQASIDPLIKEFLIKYFEGNYVYFDSKANKSYYWEGQDGSDGEEKNKLFSSYNYPDFIIKSPYRIAIEYKRSENGSIVKQGIGQSLVHTLSGNFDYVYYLFQDKNKNKNKEKL